MTLGRIRTVGAGAVLLAISVMVPQTASAADPLLPSAAAWVAIEKDGSNWVPGGPAAPGLLPFPASAITEVQFQLVKIGNGPAEGLTSVTLERPRGQYDHPFGFVMGSSFKGVFITLRKPAAGGQADWFYANLVSPKVTADEVRMKQGETTGTEVLMLTFSKVVVSHRVQTAQGYGDYVEVPPQFDIKDTVALVPAAPPSIAPVRQMNAVSATH